MSIPSFLMIVPNQPAISLLLVVILSMMALYFARRSSHRFFHSLSCAFYTGLRIASRSVKRSAVRLTERNREVLLAEGREAAEHMIDREFSRVDATLRRDMAEFPALQRQLLELVTSVDEDYKMSTEVPPSPPGWTKVVSAVAEIPSNDDPMVGDILKGIHTSLVKAHERVIDEYRTSTRERHHYLKKMMPSWRKLRETITKLGTRVDTLLDRSKILDHQMGEYEEILKRSDRALRTLSSSSMTQFFIAAFVLAIAIGGAIINFNLIARPMQEMVGGSGYLMGYKTSNIAALVIILVEVAMGIFLMESLRITRLFPIIGSIDDKKRKWMIWASFIMLFTLASIEMGLAYMRELLSEGDAALVAGLLAGTDPVISVNESNNWITTAAQMGMGFLLPFALTFVAIPLETFMHASRTVLGIAAVGMLNTISTILRILSNVSRHLGHALLNLYDLLIFAPLWIEQVVRRRAERQPEEGVVLKRQKRSKDLPSRQEPEPVDLKNTMVGL